MFDHGVTITVIRPGGVDDFGQPTAGTRHTIAGCALAPRFSGGHEGVATEDTMHGGDQVVIGLVLYAPAGSDITSTDKIASPGGVVYAVEGEPGDWTDPFTGWRPGMVVALKRVTG